MAAKVIVLGVQNHHQGQIQQIGHAQEAERLSRPAEEQPQNASHPQRCHQRTEGEHLIQHNRAHTNVLAVNLDRQAAARACCSIGDASPTADWAESVSTRSAAADREPFRSQ